MGIITAWGNEKVGKSHTRILRDVYVVVEYTQLFVRSRLPCKFVDASQYRSLSLSYSSAATQG